MKIRFWGVRGSMPTPCRANLRYGGNTACVELSLPSRGSLLLDAGTGIARAGAQLKAGSAVHLFLSHYHRDHVDGLPFFQPLYESGRSVTFYGPSDKGSPEQILRGVMGRPYFPVDFDSTGSEKNFHDVATAPVAAGEFLVRPFAMNHPQGATGYRVEAGGRVVVYATDYEPGHAVLDRAMRENVREADLFICDAQYTPAEYGEKRGWGHSTWREATRLANECGVKRLALFHHDPARDDEALDRIVEQARAAFAKTDAAREEWEVWL